MKWSWRDVIRAAGTLSTAQAMGVLGPIGCSVGRPLPALLQSRIGPPRRFEVSLPTLPVLKPIVQDIDTDYYDLRVREGTANILPGLKTKIWGYDGRFPGPTVEARSGRRIVLRLHNDLPVPIVNHLHGGHTPAESDGYPTDFILPAGQWPRGQLPTMSMRDARASVTRGVRDYTYPNNQRAATLWYHDHRMDFTGPQMWQAGKSPLKTPVMAQLRIVAR